MERERPETIRQLRRAEAQVQPGGSYTDHVLPRACLPGSGGGRGDCRQAQEALYPLPRGPRYGTVEHTGLVTTGEQKCEHPHCRSAGLGLRDTGTARPGDKTRARRESQRQKAGPGGGGWGWERSCCGSSGAGSLVAVLVPRADRVEGLVSQGLYLLRAQLGDPQNQVTPGSVNVMTQRQRPRPVKHSAGTGVCPCH